MYKVKFTPLAQMELDEFIDWLNDFNPALSTEYDFDFRKSLRRNVLESPRRWPYFFLTGSPIRAYLYSVSRRTSYWIVYEIDEKNQLVNILRFWNGARDPAKFKI